MRWFWMCVLVGGCYLHPSWSNNPLRSPEGVVVTIVGEDCEDHQGGDGQPVSRDLGVKLRIENGTGQVLRIDERAVRLVIGDYQSGIAAGDVLSVLPHEHVIVTWAFIHHVLCDQVFVLAWNHALRFESGPVDLASLSFKP